MGNGCSKCCQCNEHKQLHGTLSSASSVYRKRSRGEIPIENSDRFRITQTSNAVQLAVEHVQREDAGHYTLFARTKSNDVVRKHVELIVEDRSTGDDPPVFLRRLVDLSVKVGTRTRLLTEIRSSTDLKLTWYRNDRRICENDRITEINEGTFHYLEVSPVQLDDGGQWMLMAENLGGRNSCLATLNVLVPKAYKTPEFVEELRAVLTQQGTVSLECKVVGVPTPHLRWFKDSKEIKAGDVFALTANADDPTSLGTYTCEARNCMGVTYSSSKVHVVGRGSREGSLKPADNISSNAPPPIFTNELRDMSVRIGETIILGCQVVVPPWPKSVAWYNKDGRVDTAERYKLIEDGLGVYMIEIKPSESCDAGEWKCVVTSFEGCVGISTCTVSMDIPKNYRKPRFMESLRAVLTEEGLVSFECKVVGFPTPVLKWFKDGHELKPGDVYQLTGTNSLGTYCCIARNCMGESSSTAVLTVEDIQNQLTDEERLVFTNQNQAPRFISGLKSTDAKINEPFQFKVVVKATPDPILSWFRDELPIDPNERYNHYRGENDDWLLDIRSIEFVDQAEWKCVAVNDFGTSITSCFLKLQIPRHYKKPRFLECLRAVLTDEGAVNLECKVIGVPQPVLKWYKDGVELKPGDIHRIISGQDGTCCLGTYTCEARNCMGVVASSASLLGFEDTPKSQKADQIQENELQRNFSLSTIQEERTSQLYETPVGDITIDEKGDVSFSFDGKEVSVSLYETPDLTEEEALKIVEMYADQISEHVTEHNIVELPPLRFVKETSQSGKLLMEAVVIDISPEYFTHEDDMRTEADMDDISITEITVHGSSGREGVIDKETEKYVQESFEKMEEELSLSAPIRKRKKSRPTETDEFFSFSKASSSQGDEETSDLQTFASAQMSTSQKVISGRKSEESGTKEERVTPPKRKKSKKPSDSESSKTTEDDARLQDISGAVGDGLLVSPASHLKVVTDEAEINRNLLALVPLAKLLKVIENHLLVVENEVLEQSTMMMTPAAADQSIAIIRNILEPMKQVQSKLRAYSGETQIDALFQSMDDDIRKLHMGLQVIEKCVEIDETGTTLIQRTSVCIIDSVGEQMKKALEELKIVSKKFESESLRAQIELTADDIQQGLEITQGTIRSQALLQEAQELEAAKHLTETVEKMQDMPETISFASISEANLPLEANALKEICQPVTKIQEALERVENELSLEESEEQIYKKVHQKVLENIVQPIKDLQSTLESIEEKADSLAGSESMEQKINLAILDIVTPPLFELKKGLEVILNEKSDSVESGLLTVSTVESMVPPLQEIQNGLAQLGQDIEGGQLIESAQVIEDYTIDTEDTQKLLKSIAQAVLHFETNIELLSSRLTSNLKTRLQHLKDELSALIGTVLDNEITRHHIALFEKLKAPIDELNYCIRQTEMRSVSRSLADLIEPLTMLQEKVRQANALLLAMPDPDQNALKTLDNIKDSIRNVIIDIEEYEFNILQQEIQQDENQSSQQDKSFSALRKVLESKTSLEEAISHIDALQLALNRLNENSKTAEKTKTFTNEAQVALLHILQIAKELEAVTDTETNLNSHQESSAQVLFETSKSFANIAKALNNQAADTDNELNDILKQLKVTVSQEKKTILPNVAWSSLPIFGPLSNLIHSLDNMHPIKVSTEDLSTLDDISLLKSAAESLPTEPEAYAEQEIAVERSEKNKAETLLSDIKHGISTVLSHLEDQNVATLSAKSAEKVQAAVIKMQELKSNLALIQEANINEGAQSFSQGSEQGTFADALCSLEQYVVQVEECIAHSGAEDLSDFELSRLKALAKPLHDVRECLLVLHTQEQEQASSFSATDISMTNAALLHNLQPIVMTINEQHALETLQSLASDESLSQLKQLIDPIQDLENIALNVSQQCHLSQAESMSEKQSLGQLLQFAKPILNLREAIISVKESQPFLTLEECPALNVVKEQATSIFNLLKYCELIDVQVLEHALDLSTQEDITDLKTSADKRSVQEEVQEQVSIEPPQKFEVFDIQQGVAGGIKQLEACLNVTETAANDDLREIGEIMQQLKSDFENIQEALVSDADQQESVLAKAKIARTMFKLKECLVHTYESGLVESLENIESAFEDILVSLPVLETQLAQEMFAKIENSFKNFITYCKQPATAQQKLDHLVVPFEKLIKAIKSVADIPNVDTDKSSAVVVSLQTNLMATFRAMNEVSEIVNNDLLSGVLKTQNNLVSVFDFIENNDNSIRIIELLQEIDAITGELNALSLISNEPTMTIDITPLLENVSSGKALLNEIEEGLQNDNPLYVIFLEENSEDVGQLEEILIQIENDILSQPELTELTPKQLSLIESAELQLINLQEKLTQMNLSLLEKDTSGRESIEELPQSEIVEISNEDLTSQQLQEDIKKEEEPLANKSEIAEDSQKPAAKPKDLRESAEEVPQSEMIEKIPHDDKTSQQLEEEVKKESLRAKSDMVEDSPTKPVAESKALAQHTLSDEDIKTETQQNVVEETVVDGNKKIEDILTEDQTKEEFVENIERKEAEIPAESEPQPLDEHSQLKAQERTETPILHGYENNKNVIDFLESLSNILNEIKVTDISDWKSSDQQDLKALYSNIAEIQTNIFNGKGLPIEDVIFLPLFKLKELISYSKKTHHYEPKTGDIKMFFENTNNAFLQIVDSNDTLRRAFIHDFTDSYQPYINSIISFISESYVQSREISALGNLLKVITTNISRLKKDNLPSIDPDNAIYQHINESLIELANTLEKSSIMSKVVDIIAFNQLREGLENGAFKNVLCILQELDVHKECFIDLLEALKTDNCRKLVGENDKAAVIEKMQQNLKEKCSDLVKTIESSKALQPIGMDPTDVITNLEDTDKVAKLIFKLKEHIVHTYDGKLPTDQQDEHIVESFIDALLENCPEAAQLVINKYLGEIKENVQQTKSVILLIDDTEMFAKPSLLVPKLVNLQNIAEDVKIKENIEKS
ncbi:titin homolog [Scaptodrosophila lebanonensis]|uniref:Titin homolog n=1 Tax=Drosophila lebanonensis TaxID=7225 RepID=A0A6J2UJI2_DROLE|nr:titin homolog [Scaptodrosophila lebanonensis]